MPCGMCHNASQPANTLINRPIRLSTGQCAYQPANTLINGPWSFRLGIKTKTCGYEKNFGIFMAF